MLPTRNTHGHADAVDLTNYAFHSFVHQNALKSHYYISGRDPSLWYVIEATMHAMSVHRKNICLFDTQSAEHTITQDTTKITSSLAIAERPDILNITYNCYSQNNNVEMAAL